MKLKLYIAFLLLLPISLLAQQSGKVAYKKTVYFEFNKYDIRPSEDKALRTFLHAIKAQKEGYTIKLTGHTDAIDNDRYNQKLGMNRAVAIQNFFIEKGVPKELIKIDSKGEKVAISDNKTDTGRALNRRVEMMLITGLATDSAWLKVPRLQGKLYDADTKAPLSGEVTVTLENPKAIDKEKQYRHTQVMAYAQPITKGRIYRVHFAADGYRSEMFTITVADDENGVIYVDGPLRKMNVKKRLTYEKIYFAPNTDEFLSTATADLQRLLKFMDSDTTINIEILGHINYPLHRPKMTAEDELIFYDLSLRRAIAVQNYLIRFGVNPGRLSYRGMSNRQMVLPYARTTEECMRNMRVEVLVLN